MNILVFGEILWDVFENGKKIGGAPFNFAAHSAKLGADAYLVSAVGDDENGRDAIAECIDKGIRADYVSVLEGKATGYCTVTLKNGLPSYKLAAGVAYDAIPIPKLDCDFDAIYTGTLALRDEGSRSNFFRLLGSANTKEVIFDLNIRNGFFDRETVGRVLEKTTVFKMSDEEMCFFGDVSEEKIIKEISEKYRNIKYICLTRGGNGATVFDLKNDRIINRDAPKVEVVSTVGAGDSFISAFSVAMLSGESVDSCLDRAIALSGYVVTRLEAVPE